jgi:hypothetical protein
MMNRIDEVHESWLEALREIEKEKVRVVRAIIRRSWKIVSSE